MREYKFHFLYADGHLFRAQDYILPHDLAALEAARELRSDLIVEIWQLARRVARVRQGGDTVNASDG